MTKHELAGLILTWTSGSVKVVLAVAFLWGVYRIDDGGRMLKDVQTSVNSIKGSIGELKDTVTALTNEQIMDHRAIATLQDRH
jgi:hypothetical protein